MPSGKMTRTPSTASAITWSGRSSSRCSVARCDKHSPQCTGVPISGSASRTITESPSLEACKAAEPPPGPAPMTTRSTSTSGSAAMLQGEPTESINGASAPWRGPRRRSKGKTVDSNTWHGGRLSGGWTTLSSAVRCCASPSGRRRPRSRGHRRPAGQERRPGRDLRTASLGRRQHQ